MQRIQNFCARIICNNYNYINTRGIDLVKSLKLQAIREHRDYFLCVLMFECIHGLAPRNLSNDVTMVVDIHGYNTRSSENMDLYASRCTKVLCKRSFLYKGSMLWNDLPDVLNPAHLVYLKTTIVSSLVDKPLSIYGYIHLPIYKFNPLHISIMFLNFTEPPTFILNHDVCTLLSGFCT